MPSRTVSAAIASVLRVKVNDSSVISRVKCLAILNLLMTLPTRIAIVSRPRTGRLARPVAAAMGGQLFFGGRQQLLTFAGPLLAQHGVVAAHQPLAGKLRGADFEQVLLIEQRQLQGALLDEGFDLGGAQRADPVQ